MPMNSKNAVCFILFFLMLLTIVSGECGWGHTKTSGICRNKSIIDAFKPSIEYIVTIIMNLFTSSSTTGVLSKPKTTKINMLVERFLIKTNNREIKFIYEFIVQDKQLFTSLVEKNITDNMIKNFFLTCYDNVDKVNVIPDKVIDDCETLIENMDENVCNSIHEIIKNQYPELFSTNTVDNIYNRSEIYAEGRKHKQKKCSCKRKYKKQLNKCKYSVKGMKK